MKGIRFFIILLSMAFLLSGCGIIHKEETEETNTDFSKEYKNEKAAVEDNTQTDTEEEEDMEIPEVTETTEKTDTLSEDEIKATLYRETGMEPLEYYYDTFSGGDTYGIIAVYQYSSKFMENDSCQVWYSDGNTAVSLFEWENTTGNSFCNVADTVLYKNEEGIPYVALNTWQRVAASYNYCQIFGMTESGEIGKIYEANGNAAIENEQLVFNEATTELLEDGSPDTTVKKYKADIVNGTVKLADWSENKEDGQANISSAELSDYLEDDTVTGAADAVGGMEILSNEEFKEYAQKDKLTIGILADAPAEYNPEQINVYKQITDIINSGDQSVALFGIRIGERYGEVVNKLEEQNLLSSTSEQGNGVFLFWLGNAAKIEASFNNDQLVSYQYKLRYTG